jgi:hypothetical protein
MIGLTKAEWSRRRLALTNGGCGAFARCDPRWRRSYEGMLSAWNRMGGPFKDARNAAPKYVASSSSSTKLEWPNSTLLHGDVPAAVERLKRQGEDGALRQLTLVNGRTSTAGVVLATYRPTA